MHAYYEVMITLWNDCKLSLITSDDVMSTLKETISIVVCFLNDTVFLTGGGVATLC